MQEIVVGINGPFGSRCTTVATFWRKNLDLYVQRDQIWEKIFYTIGCLLKDNSKEVTA